MQSFNNNKNFFSDTKKPDKSEEKIRVRKLTPHKSDKQSTDCDISELSMKESSLAPSCSGSSESKIRIDAGNGNRKSKVHSKERKHGFKGSHPSYCCGSSRNMYCDCTFLDYYSDHSESRKRARRKRHRKSQKYSSDSETISISRDYCCGRCFTEKKRTRMNREILCPSCQMEFSRDKELKNDSAAIIMTAIDREQDKERESIIPASNTNNIEYDEKLSQSIESSNDSEIRQDHLRNRSKSSKSSSSTTTTRSDRQIVSVSTPDLSDAESVFIGSSSSDSERKTIATCKSCNRAASPMSDNITDAPFLKIALALEKYLER